MKDHKENFENNVKCRLINPAKSEIGKISKKILEKINKTVRESINICQWRNTDAVIKWFADIENKSNHSFMQFDIVDFYPSISSQLLTKSIDFAAQHAEISKESIETIMHARKSLLFDRGTTWTKNGDSLFDVTMGSFDGAEVCELVGIYLLSQMKSRFQMMALV